MDALKLIAQDHRTLRERFIQLERLIRLAARPRSEWTDKLLVELAIHAEREEPLLRSALAASIEGDLPEGLALADALLALRADRERLHTMFEDFAELERGLLEAKRRRVAEVAIALEAHADWEEQIFYPALAALLPNALPVQEASEEHGLVRLLTQEVMAANMRDPRLDAKLHVLMKLTLNHMREEERTLLREAKRVFTPEDRDALAAMMQEARAHVPALRVSFAPDLGALLEEEAGERS